MNEQLDEIEDPFNDSLSANFGSAEEDLAVTIMMPLVCGNTGIPVAEMIYEAIAAEHSYWVEVVRVWEQRAVDRFPEGVTPEQAQELEQSFDHILGCCVREGTPVIGCLPSECVYPVLHAVLLRCMVKDVWHLWEQIKIQDNWKSWIRKETARNAIVLEIESWFDGWEFKDEWGGFEEGDG